MQTYTIHKHSISNSSKKSTKHRRKKKKWIEHSDEYYYYYYIIDIVLLVGTLVHYIDSHSEKEFNNNNRNRKNHLCVIEHWSSRFYFQIKINIAVEPFSFYLSSLSLFIHSIFFLFLLFILLLFWCCCCYFILFNFAFHTHKLRLLTQRRSKSFKMKFNGAHYIQIQWSKCWKHYLQWE